MLLRVSPKQSLQLSKVKNVLLTETANAQAEETIYVHMGFAENSPILKPTKPNHETQGLNQWIRGITKTNEQKVATLRRQILPKCLLEVFGGDATLLLPWKNSFKAVVQDAILDSRQEITYLRNYTKERAQDLGTSTKPWKRKPKITSVETSPEASAKSTVLFTIGTDMSWSSAKRST